MDVRQFIYDFILAYDSELDNCEMHSCKITVGTQACRVRFNYILGTVLNSERQATLNATFQSKTPHLTAF